MSRLVRGFALVRICLKVLRNDLRLLLFPALLAAVVASSLVLPKLLSAASFQSMFALGAEQVLGDWLFLIVTTAFTHATLHDFRSDRRPLVESWRFSVSRTWPLAALAIGTFLFGSLCDRLGIRPLWFVTRAGLLLVVPVFIQEQRTNVFRSAWRSVRLLLTVVPELCAGWVLIGVVPLLPGFVLTVVGLLRSYRADLGPEVDRAAHVASGIHLAMHATAVSFAVALVCYLVLLPMFYAALYSLASEGAMPDPSALGEDQAWRVTG